VTGISPKEKILVVDDESNIRKILETRLTIRGYNVISASDGEEAIRLFHQEQPNLVILDIMLPKLDGYTVCSELRKKSNVPIIMLTARGDISDRVMGLEFGADDYVIKPFYPKELEARVRSLLRRSEKTSNYSSNKYLFQIGNLTINTQKQQVFS
jgi:OmpR family response regulator RpaB